MTLRPQHVVVAAACLATVAISVLPAMATSTPEPAASPEPTSTSTAEPCPTPTNDGSAVSDPCPSPSPSSPAPTAEPTDTSIGNTPTPAPAPTGTETQDPSSPNGDPAGLPDGATPTSDQTLETPADEQLVAAHPGILSGSRITMTGLSYDGVVELPTAEGSVEVLQFSMDTSVVDEFALAVTIAGGPTSVIRGDQLTAEGNVIFYTSRFEGTSAGVTYTFTPDSPPASTRSTMTFDDPDIELTAMDADMLTADTLRQTFEG